MQIETVKKTYFIMRCWRGESRRWQSFWLVAILGKFLAAGFVALLIYLLRQGPNDSFLVDVLGGLIMVGYQWSAIFYWHP